MAGDTLTTLGGYVGTYYDEAIRGQFAEMGLFQLFKPRPSRGGNSVDWTVDSQPTDYTEACSEGDSAPLDNYSVTSTATVAMQHFQGKTTVSSHAKIAARGQAGAAEYDPMAEGVAKLTKSLMNTVHGTLVTTLEAAIDASGSYGGLTRSTYPTVLLSGEESTSTALTRTHLNGAIQALLSGATTTRESMSRQQLSILCSEASYFIANKLQTPSTTYPKVRMIENSLGLDLGDNPEGSRFDGVPFVICNGLSSGTYLIGDLSYIEIVEFLPPALSALGKQNITDSVLLECDYQIVCKKPAAFYKVAAKT
jgi:hypothetical protein